MKNLKDFKSQIEMPRIRAIQCNWGQDIEFAVFGKQGSQIFSLSNATIKLHEEATAIEPFIILDKKQCQILIDDLWNCGLRPSEGTGSAGQLKAVQDHLRDFRALVRKAYQADLP